MARWFQGRLTYAGARSRRCGGACRGEARPWARRTRVAQQTLIGLAPVVWPDDRRGGGSRADQHQQRAEAPRIARRRSGHPIGLESDTARSGDRAARGPWPHPGDQPHDDARLRIDRRAEPLHRQRRHTSCAHRSPGCACSAAGRGRTEHGGEPRPTCNAIDARAARGACHRTVADSVGV